MHGESLSAKLIRNIKYLRIPLFRNSALLIGNFLIASGLGFFFWMVVANLYTEAEVGWGSAIVSAIVLLATMAVPGFGATLVRFLPESKDPARFINFTLTWSAIIAVIIAAIFVVGLPVWSPAISFVRYNPIFFASFVAFVVIVSLVRLMDTIFIAKRRADYTVYRLTITQLIKLGLPVLLVMYFNTFGIAASWGIAAGVTLVISLFVFLPRLVKHYRPVPRFRSGITTQVLRYSAGSYLAKIFQFAPAQVLPIFVVNLLGPVQNAHYYISWTIASLLMSIPMAVSQSLFAEGAHFQEEFWPNLRRALKFNFLVLTPAIVLLLVLGEWLLSLFGSGYSDSGLTLLIILGLSSIPISINHIYYSALKVLLRMRELSIVSAVSTLITLIGSYLVISEVGIIGIGWVWLISRSLICLFALYRLNILRNKK